MQFIPTAWTTLARDGSGDGIASLHSLFDASLAATAHLCPTGQLGDIRDAIFNYNPALLDRSHHDYPAIDIAIPVGTSLFAMHAGTVTVSGKDDATYTSCHLSTVLVTSGQLITARPTHRPP